MIGRRVHELRTAAGMKITELATAADVSVSWLSRAERGERAVNAWDVIENLASALGVPPGRLTGEVTVRSPGDLRTQRAVQEVADLLMSWPLGERPDGDARPVGLLGQDVWRIERMVEVGDYAAFAPMLPGLLAELHIGAADPDGAAREAVWPLLVRALNGARWISRAAGRHEVEWMVSERLAAAATETHDPAHIAFGDNVRADTLAWSGAGPGTRQRALRVARAAADRLAADADITSGDPAEAYGMLQAACMYSSALTGDQDGADAHMAEAADVAERTGNGHAFGSWFGPAQVAADRVLLAAQRQELGPALDVWQRPEVGVLPRCRRAPLLVDTARCLVTERARRGEAVPMLTRARATSSQKAYASPWIRELVDYLRAEVGGREVRELARWLGLT